MILYFNLYYQSIHRGKAWVSYLIMQEALQPWIIIGNFLQSKGPADHKVLLLEHAVVPSRGWLSIKAPRDFSNLLDYFIGVYNRMFDAL